MGQTRVRNKLNKLTSGNVTFDLVKVLGMLGKYLEGASRFLRDIATERREQCWLLLLERFKTSSKVRQALNLMSPGRRDTNINSAKLKR